MNPNEESGNNALPYWYREQYWQDVDREYIEEMNKKFDEYIEGTPLYDAEEESHFSGEYRPSDYWVKPIEEDSNMTLQPHPDPLGSKSTEMRDLLEFLNPGTLQAIKDGNCTWCRNPVGLFRDQLSVKEHGISGMCQVCQDKTFTKPSHFHPSDPLDEEEV